LHRRSYLLLNGNNGKPLTVGDNGKSETHGKTFRFFARHYSA